MNTPISSDSIRKIWVLVSHYIAVGILGYLAYLLYLSGEILQLAAVAVVFLTLLVLLKAAGESLEAFGVIDPAETD